MLSGESMTGITIVVYKYLIGYIWYTIVANCYLAKMISYHYSDPGYWLLEQRMPVLEGSRLKDHFSGVFWFVCRVIVPL